MKKFKEKEVSPDFTTLMDELVDKDLKQVIIPDDVLSQIKMLNDIRDSINPDKIDKYFTNNLLQIQAKIANAKYLIGRHLSAMKGAQSYAFIYRKFKTASDWNTTKLKLGNGKVKPTINEIESELEKNLVNVRKTEVVYQVASDKLMSLLDWCDNMMMIIQNRIREVDTDRKTTNYNRGVVPNN
jgi:hypothetical protein